jgi:hypothetical protein
MNSYCTIADIKTGLGLTTTTDDTILRKMCEGASRAIDKYTNRFFYCLKATKFYDGSVPLWIDDLLSIDTNGLKIDDDGDQTYDDTFASTDYHLYPLNTYPKTRIELAIEGDYTSFGITPKGCQIAGLWGYGDGISATPYIIDTTLGLAIGTTTETTVTFTAVTNLSAGDTFLCGTEQIYIYSISSLVGTVERGVNGTTAAAHLLGASIYIYQYPEDIRQACIDLATALYLNRNKAGMASERLGDYSYTMLGAYSGSANKNYIQVMLESTVKSYRKVEF